jgi:hypothetical protein
MKCGISNRMPMRRECQGPSTTLSLYWSSASKGSAWPHILQVFEFD